MLWASIGVALLAVGTVGILVTIQGARFRRRVANEARELSSAKGPGQAARRSLDGLPAPVRRYMEASGAAGRAAVRSVRIRHGGTFRPAPDKAWTPIRGEQYFATDPPGFVWWGRIRLAPGLYLEARDRSLMGEGNMLIRVASTFTLADARGPAMDQGALVRLLAEMAWFPTALLDERYVTWAPIDDERARATLRVGGREASLTFRFGGDRLPTGIEGERYQEVRGKSVLAPWLGAFRDYRMVGGLRIPFQSEVSWQVDGKVDPYARWVFEEVEFDRAEPY